VFQYRLAFFNDVNFLSTASMASPKSSILQLPIRLVSCLITLVDFYHGCDSGWRGMFSLLGVSWSSMLLLLLHGTLKFMVGLTPQDQASTKWRFSCITNKRYVSVLLEIKPCIQKSS
jgi:hypothetical protein